MYASCRVPILRSAARLRRLLIIGVMFAGACGSEDATRDGLSPDAAADDGDGAPTDSMDEETDGDAGFDGTSGDAVGDTDDAGDADPDTGRAEDVRELDVTDPTEDMRTDISDDADSGGSDIQDASTDSCEDPGTDAIASCIPESECSTGLGVCAMFGTCSSEGSCDAVAGSPEAGSCDFEDDDCDGSIDELRLDTQTSAELLAGDVVDGDNQILEAEALWIGGRLFAHVRLLEAGLSIGRLAVVDGDDGSLSVSGPHDCDANPQIAADQGLVAITCDSFDNEVSIGLFLATDFVGAGPIESPQQLSFTDPRDGARVADIDLALVVDDGTVGTTFNSLRDGATVLLGYFDPAESVSETDMLNLVRGEPASGGSSTMEEVATGTTPNAQVPALAALDDDSLAVAFFDLSNNEIVYEPRSTVDLAGIGEARRLLAPTLCLSDMNSELLATSATTGLFALNLAQETPCGCEDVGEPDRVLAYRFASDDVWESVHAGRGTGVALAGDDPVTLFTITADGHWSTVAIDADGAVSGEAQDASDQPLLDAVSETTLPTVISFEAGTLLIEALGCD